MNELNVLFGYDDHTKRISKSKILKGEIMVSLSINQLINLLTKSTNNLLTSTTINFEEKERMTTLLSASKIKLLHSSSHTLINTKIRISLAPFVFLNELHLVNIDLSILSMFDSSLQKCRFLRKITYENGSLYSLTNLLQTKTALTSLSKLNNLTEEERIWISMETLIVVHSKMTEIDDSIKFLPSLKYLNLTNNKLSQINNCIESLEALVHLDASFNRIKEVHSCSMPFLAQFLIRYNNLSDINCLLSFKNLVTLDLAYNMICYIEVIFPLHNLPAIQKLWLEGNPISYLPTYRMDVLSIFAMNYKKSKMETFLLDNIALSKNELTQLQKFFNNHSLSNDNIDTATDIRNSIDSDTGTVSSSDTFYPADSKNDYDNNINSYRANSLSEPELIITNIKAPYNSAVNNTKSEKSIVPELLSNLLILPDYFSVPPTSPLASKISTNDRLSSLVVNNRNNNITIKKEDSFKSSEIRIEREASVNAFKKLSPHLIDKPKSPMNTADLLVNEYSDLYFRSYIFVGGKEIYKTHWKKVSFFFHQNSGGSLDEQQITILTNKNFYILSEGTGLDNVKFGDKPVFPLLILIELKHVHEIFIGFNEQWLRITYEDSNTGDIITITILTRNSIVTLAMANHVYQACLERNLGVINKGKVIEMIVENDMVQFVSETQKAIIKSLFNGQSTAILLYVCCYLHSNNHYLSSSNSKINFDSITLITTTTKIFIAKEDFSRSSRKETFIELDSFLISEILSVKILDKNVLKISLNSRSVSLIFVDIEKMFKLYEMCRH